jgi:hypothetical protein
VKKLHADNGKKFFDLFYSGLPKSMIASKLGCSIPILQLAFPTVNFQRRGSIKPPFVSKRKWIDEEWQAERSKRIRARAVKAAEKAESLRQLEESRQLGKVIEKAERLHQVEESTQAEMLL